EPPGIALHYVSKLARGHVKVLLAGEGGDEAFGGYQTYRSLLWLERLKAGLGPFTSLLSKGCARFYGDHQSGRLERYGPLLTQRFEDYYYSRASSPSSFFNSHKDRLYLEGFQQIVGQQSVESPMAAYMRASSSFDLVNRMLYVDTKSWLPD